MSNYRYPAPQPALGEVIWFVPAVDARRAWAYPPMRGIVVAPRLVLHRTPDELPMLTGNPHIDLHAEYRWMCQAWRVTDLHTGLLLSVGMRRREAVRRAWLALRRQAAYQQGHQDLALDRGSWEVFRDLGIGGACHV
jgi:hypothetical protein